MMVFQFGMSTTSSSPGIYSAAEEVGSLPILNLKSKNIHCRNKNIKIPAVADSLKKCEGFIEFPVKAKQREALCVHR